MKFFIPLLFSLSFAYGQTYQDGYHVDTKPECQFEACLIAQETEIGLLSYQDQDGNTVYAMNTKAGFTDILYKGASACFRGESARCGRYSYRAKGE